MVKGDKRRAQIVDKARELFMASGCAGVSVQDVLDALGISKGCFYHYFDTREQLFGEACASIMDEYIKEGLLSAGAAQGGAVERLNALFEGSGVWSGDAPFVTLLTRAIYNRDIWLKEFLYDALIDAFVPQVERILVRAVEAQELYTAYPSYLADTIVRLMADMTCRLCRGLINSHDGPQVGDVTACLVYYRSVVEKLLDASFGQVTLCGAGELTQLCRRVWENDVRPVLFGEKGEDNAT